MPMRLRYGISGTWFGLAGVMIALSTGGCGEGDFVPPPPPELRGAMGTTSAAPKLGSSTATTDLLGSAANGVKSIELILSGGRDPNEIETEKAAARLQAGADKARLKITVVGEETSEGPKPAPLKDQATLVREAVARHPQALIVEPGDPADKELAKAIHEAQAAKVPVVLLDRPLAQGAGNTGAPTILVEPEPFADSARQLVASAIRNAKNAKLDPQGGAVLLINTAGDPFIPDRVAALRDALKAAGIKSIEQVRFPGDNSAEKLLSAYLKANPKPSMVFSVDFVSSSGTNETVTQISEERPFIQAGYTSDDNQLRLARLGEFAALGQYIPNRLIRKAISTAIAAALKQEVQSPIRIPVVIHESPPNAGVARFQSRQKAGMKAKATPSG
ncbi:MAG: sugar ABC transporter substrate-binding protein [Isosphaeraceae bacterium]